MATDPINDGALFDMLHGLFGIGDFNDSTEDQRWFQHRIREIVKIKAIRKRRSITVHDFALAARYCFNHQLPIHESYQICAYVLDAKREKRLRLVSSVAQEVDKAVEIERAKAEPDQQMIDKLLRARATGRQVVLDEWRESHRKNGGNVGGQHET